MTLPTSARQLINNNNNNSDKPIGATPLGCRKTTSYLTTSADPWTENKISSTTTNKESKSVGRRSWHFGYGALHEVEEISGVVEAAANADHNNIILKKGTVAEQASLLDAPSSRRLSSVVSSRPKIRLPPPVINEPSSESTTTIASGLLSRFRKGRRGSGNNNNNNNNDENDQLVKRGGQTPSASIVKSTGSFANLRKCETVLALTSIIRSASSSSSIIEPLQPLNRLRVPPDNNSNCRLCSRCSSLLTLASGSRYSLDSAAGGFIRVPPSSSSSSTPETPAPILCKLCLEEVPILLVVKIQQCDCAFCSKCMKAYVEFEISEGAYDISCPDAQCSSQGVLQQEEIKRLAGNDLLEKHKKYRLNREVELDKSRMWCPKAGCETVCLFCPTHPCSPQSVSCPTCSTDFCSNCKLEWHEGITCDEYGKKLIKEGKPVPDVGIPFDSDLIKSCPMCGVPIEKDEGCAQMMCKRCKHVFCWYCLASLDDDFLLRHYDKGPCKNKLGHSRASVIWHRTQVIGIFAGFGILLLVASPLLLLAAPCIVCCKCRICNAGSTKLNTDDDVQDD